MGLYLQILHTGLRLASCNHTSTCHGDSKGPRYFYTFKHQWFCC